MFHKNLNQLIVQKLFEYLLIKKQTYWPVVHIEKFFERGTTFASFMNCGKILFETRIKQSSLKCFSITGEQ